jgi:hypothetical protein
MTFSGCPSSSNVFLKGVDTMGTLFFAGVVDAVRFWIAATMIMTPTNAAAIFNAVIGIMVETNC